MFQIWLKLTVDVDWERFAENQKVIEKLCSIPGSNSWLIVP